MGPPSILAGDYFDFRIIISAFGCSIGLTHRKESMIAAKTDSRMRRLTMTSFVSVAIICILSLLIAQVVPETADGQSSVEATIDQTGASGIVEGDDFGINDFSRAQVGSNREVDGVYFGYTYLTGADLNAFSAVFVNMESDDPYVVLYIPESAEEAGVSVSDVESVEAFKNLLGQMDEFNANGGVTLANDQMTWYVTSDESITIDGVIFSFAQELREGRGYTCVIGEDSSDVTAQDNPNQIDLGHCSYGVIAPASEVTVVESSTGWSAVVEFFTELDYRPLFVSLRTTLVALVIIFVLGLLAAYWVLTLSPRVRSIMDAIFTIPMVLPPTVCGFILLMLLGRNSLVGQWFINIGFPLIFSWQATVISAVVVAFPLMYMNAKGAFEGLDNNMLDAARTLGWSSFRIFRKLMLPLTWTSIAAGTALSFARASGEFGATLFLAGNYAGITQTIPLAIYFQWMNGRTDIAIFWTLVMILICFVVLLFINVWSNRTTKYRRRDSDGA